MSNTGLGVCKDCKAKYCNICATYDRILHDETMTSDERMDAYAHKMMIDHPDPEVRRKYFEFY